MKTVHMGAKIKDNGDVSALCYWRFRRIDRTKATWTNRREAVTCRKCRAALEQRQKDTQS